MQRIYAMHGIIRVILDDMDSDWDRVGLADYWINTENTVKGFSESDAREVINILNS